MDLRHEWVRRAKAAHEDLVDLVRPPEEGGRSALALVISTGLTKGTRGYIERVVAQINGAYESGYYDACAVMLRRLLETLIIETFEAKGIDGNIKNGGGDFFHLRDLVDLTLNEPSWNLGRSAKKALRELKDIGDKSAHSRRFTAHRSDIDRLIPKAREVVQELMYLSGLK